MTYTEEWPGGVRALRALAFRQCAIRNSPTAVCKMPRLAGQYSRRCNLTRLAVVSDSGMPVRCKPGRVSVWHEFCCTDANATAPGEMQHVARASGWNANCRRCSALAYQYVYPDGAPHQVHLECSGCDRGNPVALECVWGSRKHFWNTDWQVASG